MKTVIFVFGSNLAGRHGKGSALVAAQKFKAQYGIGQGRTGNAYAIPTKDENLRVLTINVIKQSVNLFIKYAEAHSELEFHVAEVGCGLAGYTPAQIAPLFRNAPNNCFLPQSFKNVLQRS